MVLFSLQISGNHVKILERWVPRNLLFFFFKQLPRFFLGTLKLEDHHLRYTRPPKTPKHLFSYCYCYFCSFCMESHHSPSQIQMFVLQPQLKYHLLSEDFSHNCFFPSPLPQLNDFTPFFGLPLHLIHSFIHKNLSYCLIVIFS